MQLSVVIKEINEVYKTETGYNAPGDFISAIVDIIERLDVSKRVDSNVVHNQQNDNEWGK